MTSPAPDKGHRLLRNSGWSLLTAGLPAIALVAFVPYLFENLGEEQFGLLAVILGVLAYSTALNLGLGKAVTRRLSGALAADEIDSSDLIRTVWTSASAQFAIGLSFAALLSISAPTLASILGMSDQLEGSAALALAALAPVIPLTLVTTTFRGIFHAANRFRVVAFVDVPAGILLYTAPALVVSQGGGIVEIVHVLVVVRLVALLVLILASLATVPWMRAWPRYDNRTLAELMKFGSWLAVTDAVLPLFAYMDRFVVASVIGVGPAAIYSIPQDIVNRLWMLPSAISMALYPAASSLSASVQPGQFVGVVDRARMVMFVTILPACSLAALVSLEIFTLWISEEFATSASPVFAIFLLGLAVNSLAMITSAALVSQGHSGARASVLLLEIPIFLVGLWVLIPLFGLTGAAMAWTARMVVTSVAVQLISRRLVGLSVFPRSSTTDTKVVIIVSSLFLVALPVAWLGGFELRLVSAMVVVLVTLVLVRNLVKK